MLKSWIEDGLSRWMLKLIRIWSRRSLGDNPIQLVEPDGTFAPVYHTGRRVTVLKTSDGFEYTLHCYFDPNPRTPLQRTIKLPYRGLYKENGAWKCKRV